MTVALHLEGVSFAYPETQVLSGLSLKIAAGERVALLGPNGGGKSTLLLCIVGVLELERGTVRLGETALTRETCADIQRRVGMLFQDPDDQLFMETVADDVAFGPRNRGLPEEDVQAIVDRTLAMTGTADLRDRSPGHLSGGQKRAVAIAGVIAQEPDVLLLDEPTANLDHRASRRTLDIVRSLPQTMVIASHDIGFVAACCERVVVLDDGRIAFDGSWEQAKTSRGHLEDHGVFLPEWLP